MQPNIFLFLFSIHSTNLLISAGFDEIRRDMVVFLNHSLTLQRRRFTDQIIQVLGLDHMKEGYGCWCYFDPESIAGKAPKGIAVNSVDESCKSLQHGYQCAELDGEVEEESCEPHTVFYYSSIRSILLGKEDLHESCTSRNTNHCSQRACTVEGQFVLNIGKAYISGDVFDKEPSHAAGFDTSVCHASPVIDNSGVNGNGGNGNNIFGIDRQMAEEPVVASVTEGTVVPQFSCCGNYPNRFPYHSDDASKKCCVNSNLNGISKVYDSGLYECCDDGTTMVTCG